jgi:hypothetical protein
MLIGGAKAEAQRARDDHAEHPDCYPPQRHDTLTVGGATLISRGADQS